VCDGRGNVAGEYTLRSLAEPFHRRVLMHADADWSIVARPCGPRHRAEARNRKATRRLHRDRGVNGRIARIVPLCLALVLLGCGKFGEQAERERAAREAEVQKAIAQSLAEERAKDQRMHEAAVAEAGERIQRSNAEFEEERAKAAAEQPAADRAQAAAADALQRYTDRLRQFFADPDLQLRNAVLSPKGNGMCAEVSVKDKSGTAAGFKRVVVTDTGVNSEEPPNRDTLTYFLAFQVAARDTGCFPDVLNVHFLR